MLKCSEDIGSGSFENKPVINEIHAVGCNGNPVGYEEKPRKRFLVYGIVPEIKRDYLQQKEHHVYIYCRRDVENQSAFQYGNKLPGIYTREHFMIEDIKSYAAEEEQEQDQKYPVNKNNDYIS